MKIDKNELQSVLKIVKPGLGDGKSVEQSTSFAFIKDRVVTYNDQIAITHPITGMQITGAVQAEQLYKLLDKIKTEEIDIVIKNDQLRIKGPGLSAGITLQKEIKLPIDTIEKIILADNEKGWALLPDAFCSMLNFAHPVCATDMSRVVLTCMYIYSKGIIASDSFRILHQSFTYDADFSPFLLPAEAARKVIPLNPVKIKFSDGWVHFKTEQNTIISCRLMIGEFPANKALQFLSDISEGVKITLPKNISEMVDTARIFSIANFDYNERVDIMLEEGVLTVYSKSEIGWAKKKKKIKYKGKCLSFGITPILFDHIFKQTQTFLFADNRVKFSGDNWEYLVNLKK